jgi:hypothetical protein
VESDLQPVSELAQTLHHLARAQVASRRSALTVEARRVALLGAAALCNLARDVQENKRKLVVCQALDVLKSFHQCYMESEAHLRMYTLALNSLSPL